MHKSLMELQSSATVSNTVESLPPGQWTPLSRHSIAYPLLSARLFTLTITFMVRVARNACDVSFG